MTGSELTRQWWTPFIFLIQTDRSEAERSHREAALTPLLGTENWELEATQLDSEGVPISQ